MSGIQKWTGHPLIWDEQLRKSPNGYYVTYADHEAAYEPLARENVELHSANESLAAALAKQREEMVVLLKAARELADAVSHAPGTTWDADLVAALARFKEVDK